jgi:hypothetical protein
MAIARPTEEERLALCEWMTANGIDIHTVQLYDSDLRITEQDGRRLVRYTEYVLSDDGRKQVDPQDESKDWMRESSAHCVVDPPAWLNVPGGRP